MSEVEKSSPLYIREGIQKTFAIMGFSSSIKAFVFQILFFNPIKPGTFWQG